PGTIVFTRDNTYRGLTTINDGTLTVQSAFALGAWGTPQNGTVVNETLTKVGTLQVDDPTGIGFTIRDEQLTLSGPGVGGHPIFSSGIGALTNFRGNNTWASSITLGV